MYDFSICPHCLRLCGRRCGLLKGGRLRCGARGVGRRLTFLDSRAGGERGDSRDGQAGNDDVFHISSIYLSVVVVVVVEFWIWVAGATTVLLTTTFEATRLSPSFT